MKKMMIILSICSFCFLFAGCSSDKISTHDNVDTVDTMEDGLQEMESGLPLMEIVPIVEDNWPESIGREDENTTAENLSFDIVISNPMTLSISCVTESGKLDMEINSDDGEKIFSESDIQTENFEVKINSSGTYKVTIQAEKHTGSFGIEPQK